MNHRHRRPNRLLGLALLLAVTALPSHALSDEEIFRDFPFNLINPGARALGVGGAFISLADDSTAAQTNPAGVVNLRRPELFAELRSRSIDGSGVRTAGRLNGAFFQGDLSTLAASDPDTNLTPAFLSFVIPFERVAFGFSRLESLNVGTRTRNRFTIEGQEAIVQIDPVTGDPIIIGFQPVDFDFTAEADVNALVVQYNAVVGISLHRRLSLGLTAVFGQAEVDGRVDNLFQDLANGIFTEQTLDYATRIDDTDTDIAYNLGLQWRPSDWISLGAVYRKGLRFELEQRIGPQGVRASEARELYGERFTNVLPMPDSYGLGVSFRPSEPWTVLVDAVRVEYSDLLQDYVSGLNRISFPEEFVPFTVDDGTEVHVGVERIFLAGRTPVAARLGGWREPDDRIRAAEESGLSLVFPAGEEVDHVTAGVGVTLQQSIQLDFAADISDVSSQFVFSSIYRF